MEVNADRDRRAPLLARLALYYKESGAFGKAADVVEEIMRLLPDNAGLAAELAELRAKAASE
ncbi:MAG: hypothetical protein HYW56_00595 [Candidatus Harrisonbacteria bacterium]|nr:hypothetical protein [Candidatus Harrisonbacteria bacterium]